MMKREKERRMKKRMSVSEAARIMGRAGRGDCKRRNVDYRKLARMAVAARRKKALMNGVNGIEKGKEKK
jgi:hypothetical protein